MEVLVNNRPLETPLRCTLEELLLLLAIQHPQGMALAVNDAVIAKSEWKSYTLQPSDKITLIKATQGG